MPEPDGVPTTISVQITCPKCGGKGVDVYGKDLCDLCNGLGQISVLVSKDHVEEIQSLRREDKGPKIGD